MLGIFVESGKEKGPEVKNSTTKEFDQSVRNNYVIKTDLSCLFK